MELETEGGRRRDGLAALGQVIVGKSAVLRQILSGILANGHILIEDYPGLAKTLIARLVSESLDLGFKRIQFTPDLLPSDITGSFLYDQREGRFEFRRGPIFTNLLLADEINRATPKTQSALLEAMQESQVTIEGERFPLEAPFLVIATQNPIELEGTYPLPEAQLDRFLMRLQVGYPDRDEEIEIRAGDAPAGRPLAMPLVLRPYQHENEQFGYMPDYPTESQFYFDSRNRPLAWTDRGIAHHDGQRWLIADLAAAVRSGSGDRITIWSKGDCINGRIGNCEPRDFVDSRLGVILQLLLFLGLPGAGNFAHDVAQVFRNVIRVIVTAHKHFTRAVQTAAANDALTVSAEAHAEHAARHREQVGDELRIVADLAPGR